MSQGTPYEDEATDPQMGRPLDAVTSTARIRGIVKGRGPAVVLVHGFPETHMAWHRIWDMLASKFTVIACDLRGYGDSVALGGDFTFRTMGEEILEVMDQLAVDRFQLVGHDRGGRVAHRIAVDHADRVSSITLIDILPTAMVWEMMDARLARAYWHWPFLAQPEGVPERLIASDPIGFLHAWLGIGGSKTITPDALASYERAALRPSVQRAFCADYRAAAGPDLDIDARDRPVSGFPARIFWGREGLLGTGPDPVALWRSIFPDIAGRELPGGHFIPEESPLELLEALLPFLAENANS